MAVKEMDEEKWTKKKQLAYVMRVEFNLDTCRLCTKQTPMINLFLSLHSLFLISHFVGWIRFCIISFLAITLNCAIYIFFSSFCMLDLATSKHFIGRINKCPMYNQKRAQTRPERTRKMIANEYTINKKVNEKRGNSEMAERSSRREREMNGRREKRQEFSIYSMHKFALNEVMFLLCFFNWFK